MKRFRVLAIALLVFVVLVSAFVSIDRLWIHRHFPEFTIHKGMAIQDVVARMGQCDRDVGSGLFIPEWELASCNVMKVVVINGVVEKCYVNDVDLSYSHYYLPIIIVFLAITELLICVPVLLFKKRERT